MRPRLRRLPAAAKRRAGWLVRDRLMPNRRVVRDVQGVRMVLPWSHRLPDYAAAGAGYGQNLVELAQLLAETGPLTMLDVGANVGDSALQVLNAADGKVLCVEGDTAYLAYLHANADADERISIAEALLTLDERDRATTAVREGGTTRFAEGGIGDAMPSVTPAELRERFRDFADLRLIKSDTDGYDVSLVPALAEEWAQAQPVLFFEYDPYLVELAGLDPLAVWPRLSDLGYRQVAVWDNGATPVGRCTTAEIGDRSAALAEFPNGRANSRTYWDVALAHEDDESGQAALDRLVPAGWRGR